LAALGATAVLAHLNSVVDAAVKGTGRTAAVAAPSGVPLKAAAHVTVMPAAGLTAVGHPVALAPTPPVLPITGPTWGGYTVTGGPFSSVSGTFMVPYLYGNGRCGEGLSNWVGVDGSGDGDLLQAGVQETYTDPQTGGCDPSAAFWVVAWWEVLPATETVVHSVQVHPGDRVTVSVWQTDVRGLWSVSMRDDTDGQGFTRLTSYPGAGRSAEWVDEAFSEPAGTECGPGIAPDGNGMVVCALAPYSGDTWTKLSLPGCAKVTGVEQKTIVQQGVAVSAPSPVLDLPELLSDRFIDTYTGDARA
jgi:hypothetical protein